MKKITVALLLVCLMLGVCVGCGSSDAPAASVSATMAPVEETAEAPEATAEPTPEPITEPEAEEAEPAEEEAEPAEEEEPAESASANSGNSQPQPEVEAKPEPTAEPVEEDVDKYSVAVDMQGSSVEDLYTAIGQPNGSEYTASCLIPTGEDGLLYYDDFTVSTIRYPDGTELVMGAF